MDREAEGPPPDALLARLRNLLGSWGRQRQRVRPALAGGRRGRGNLRLILVQTENQVFDYKRMQEK